MSVKIGISIKQNSYSKSTNSSSVTVTVTASWKGGSWNHLNPPGWVKIDGKTYNFNASFNKRRTSSGSCNLYSKKVTVKHSSNGTKKLSCSASYSSNVSSGTVTASASKTLTRSGSSSSTSKSSSSKRPTITAMDIQHDTDRTVFVTWSWNKDHTDHYVVRWYYATGDGVWFRVDDSDVKPKQHTYNAPQNAYKVRVYVKPVSTKHKVNKKEVSWWTADWSKPKDYYFKNNPPETPPVPEVEIEKTKLTAEVNNLDINATYIEFQIVRDDKSVYKTIKAKIKTRTATCSCTVALGSEYKVRCRGIRGKEYSDWSEYSGNAGTIPIAPSGITALKALTSTSVFLDWNGVKCDNYKIEYTEKKEYFDSSPNNVSSVTIDAKAASHAEITGLELGKEWFFRLRAEDEDGASNWTAIKSIILGKKPSAPTTWSSTTTAIVGEPLNLYWVHNSEDGSSQKYAELEMDVDGVKTTQTIKNTENEDEKDKTSVYPVDTSKWTEGTVLKWRVRTSGVTLEYGDWSIQRTVDIYAKPTLDLAIKNSNSEMIDTITSFPFYISGLAGPKTQEPIGYHLSIISNEVYETVDEIGNVKVVNDGEPIYSKYFDTSDPLLVEMSAGNIDLENGIPYTVNCTVSMNSGLTAEQSLDFTVLWEDEKFIPDAEIGIDYDTLTAIIRPYCEEYETLYYKVNYDSVAGTYTKTTEQLVALEGLLVDGAMTDTGDNVFVGILNEVEIYFCVTQATEAKLVQDILLSVYRREYDGSFQELATELENNREAYITDPHPSLDFARYRIVATTKSTGAVSYYDVPGYPVNEKAIIIQWDDEWTTFDTYGSEDELAEPPWSGSMLKLPYNIDISDSNNADTSLIEYIGRKRPVSYYGTQIGETSTWNAEIEKSDIETLYTIRRLATWMGDVYVREPSGSGYWANISVSYSQKHLGLTIPVTFNITRVEGGA